MKFKVGDYYIYKSDLIKHLIIITERPAYAVNNNIPYGHIVKVLQPKDMENLFSKTICGWTPERLTKLESPNSILKELL